MASTRRFFERREAEIRFSQSDTYTLVLGLVRYSLGRMTYIVGEACRITRETAPYLSVSELGVIIRDIEEQDRFGYGMDMDRREWMALLEWLKRHVQEREG